MCYINTILGGTNFAYPDTCNTLVGTTTSPIPYSNSSFGTGSSPGEVSPDVYMDGGCVTLLTTEVPISTGNEASVSGGGGVASGEAVGSTTYSSGTSKLLVNGVPVPKLTSATMQNGTNAVGATLVPSQYKVMSTS